MTGIHVGLSDRQIIRDHLHCGVAKQALERPGIAFVAQIENGKSVAEAVGMAVFDICTISNFADNFI